MTLIQEFHSDHQKVVAALVELNQAIALGAIARVRSILDGAEDLVRPHFKFEEQYLYPALKRFPGEAYVEKLLNEHDRVFGSMRRIARLAQEKVWFDDEFRSARRNLQLIYEHLMSCDGLSLWMERLPLQEQDELLDRMREIRQQGSNEASPQTAESRPAGQDGEPSLLGGRSAAAAKTAS